MNCLGSNSENIKNLGVLFKLLPNNLVNFYLNLSDNELGRSDDNFRYLADSMKYLPKYLLNLDLNL